MKRVPDLYDQEREFVEFVYRPHNPNLLGAGKSGENVGGMPGN